MCCERGIFAMVLFILVWTPLAFGGMSAWGFLVVQGVTVAALALWIVRLWAQRRFRLLWPPMCWAVLAFLLYAVVRCRFVAVEYAGRQQLIHVLIYGALFFLALNNLNRKNSATFVSFVLIGVGSAMALLAVYQFARHCPTIWGADRPYVGRGSGTFINPNNFAGFLEMMVPLALSFAVMGRFGATIKVLLGYCTLVMLAGVVVSLSRGGVVASTIAVVMFCGLLLMQRDFWKPALAALCVLGALALLATSQLGSLQKRFDEGTNNEFNTLKDHRQNYWAAAWQLFEDSKVWGVGPGHFDVEFPSVRPWAEQTRPHFAHNDYLNTLCDWGLAGAALVAASCALLAWGVSRTWIALRRPDAEMGSRFSDRSAFVLGAAFGLAALMIHCVVDFNMQIAAVAITAVVLMALLTAQLRFATEAYWRNPGLPGKALMTVMAAGVMAYLTSQGLLKGEQTYWLDQAADAVATPEKAVACATKAAEADPADWECDYNLAEYLWQLTLLGGPSQTNVAKEAFEWYSKAMQLDRFDAYAPVGCGMCLDVLGRTNEATPYFNVAHQKDPHNGYIALELARHYIELGDLKTARRWMNDAIRSEGTDVALKEATKLGHYMEDPLYPRKK